MGLCVGLPGGEELLPTLSFIVLKRLLLGLLTLQGDLLLEFMRLLVSHASLLGQLEFDAPIDICL